MQIRRWISVGRLVMGSALLVAALPLIAQEVPPAPTMPSTSATEAPVVPSAPIPPPPSDTDEPSAKTGPTFEFGLRGEEKCIAPYTHGDAKTEEGKIDVVPAENNLTVTITGGGGAEVFLRRPSGAEEAVPPPPG